MQRFHSVLVHNGFIDDDPPELGALPNKFGSLFLEILSLQGFSRAKK